jgi:dihydrofolate reductase
LALSLIYARSENYCIGRNGDLPWELPDEFAHFTRTTTGGAVIMGRKTYQDHNSYLSGRLNIVVTRNPGLKLAANVMRASSLEAAIALAEQGDGEIFVIGGRDLLREALPLARTVYETVVHAEIAGDTFVDQFDFSGWHTEVLQQHSADAAHAYGFTIYRHDRRNL